MEIRPLQLADAQECAAWYASVHAGASAGRIAPLIVESNALLTSLRTKAENSSLDSRAIGAWKGAACVGTAVVELPRRENRHQADIDINVPPEHRGRGVGGALFDECATLARRAGRRTFCAEINVPTGHTLQSSPGGRFALRRGFVDKHAEDRLVLELPVTQALLDDPPVGFSTVSWVGAVPPEYAEPFAALCTAMDRDVPTGDLDREPIVYDRERVEESQRRLVEQGYGLVTTVVLAPDGKPAAYTGMLVLGPSNVDVTQEDTFVERAHRGQRLATVAKVANMRTLTAHYPGARYVHTWTDPANDPMRSINRHLGFAPVERLHEMQLS